MLRKWTLTPAWWVTLVVVAGFFGAIGGALAVGGIGWFFVRDEVVAVADVVESASEIVVAIDFSAFTEAVNKLIAAIDFIIQFYRQETGG